VPELRFGAIVVPDAPTYRQCFAALVRRLDRFSRDGTPNDDGPDRPACREPHPAGPAVIAKAAAAIDHLSNGRLELAIGKGVEEFDHRATGHALLVATGARISLSRVRSGRRRRPPKLGEPFSFEGRYYRTQESALAPATVQRSRPPITVGGQSPSVRRVAAERGDCWNTFALGDVPFNEILETVRHQNRELDQLCAEVGKEPTTLRRSPVSLARPAQEWLAPNFRY
jgi:alkanesulfonate monooxygenase SsuD/methylene tetrahydromethanopterin reductase-like flavin-dependent oxidoreductase (luciferase family)